MRFRSIIAIIAFFVSASSFAQERSRYDLNKPFGWATCTSLTDAGTAVTGADPNGKMVALTSDGGDMTLKIFGAIKRYDIIVLDGKDGEFSISQIMRFKGLQNKTIVGINGARLSTKFKLAADVRKMLDDKGVMKLESKGDGKVDTLSNGRHVKEARERAVRQALIDYTKDEKESFRESGIFSFSECENIIIRNLVLVGPGAVDVGGSDLMTISHHTKHIWVDHCEFVDGMDGNFDINSFSDFITVSWCKFRYTENTYDHANTNLVGSNDNPEHNGADNLNVTYAFCNWAEGCNQRMPMVRFGTIHLLNDLYTCNDCALAVNARKDSEVLIEGCVFDKGVAKVFRANDAKSFVFRNSLCLNKNFKQPANEGTVSVPYEYTAMPTIEVMTEVQKFSGATLLNPFK